MQTAVAELKREYGVSDRRKEELGLRRAGAAFAGRLESAPMAENGYLLFVWKPTGYELVERAGDAPKVGDSVEIDERTEWVCKVAPSPCPATTGSARTYKPRGSRRR